MQCLPRNMFGSADCADIVSLSADPNPFRGTNCETTMRKNPYNSV